MNVGYIGGSITKLAATGYRDLGGCHQNLSGQAKHGQALLDFYG